MLFFFPLRDDGLQDTKRTGKTLFLGQRGSRRCSIQQSSFSLSLIRGQGGKRNVQNLSEMGKKGDQRGDGRQVGSEF